MHRARFADTVFSANTVKSTAVQTMGACMSLNDPRQQEIAEEFAYFGDWSATST
jgi:hypothetical protein